MKALVTGGAGLIGSHLVDRLVSDGHDVVFLDNLDPVVHPTGRPRWLNPEAEFRYGDIRNRGQAARALVGCDWLFHQAAYGGFSPDSTKVTDVNCLGTATLLAAAARVPSLSKIVVASSQAVYGPGPAICAQCQEAQGREYVTGFRNMLRHGAADRWQVRCLQGHPATNATLSEDTPTDPRTPYALSKFYTERLALEQLQRTGVPTVALRYALTYGPRQSLYNPYTGVMSIFATQAANGVPPVVYEDGLQLRDFVYVTDIVDANIKAAEHPAATGPYVVGTGVGTPILDVAQRIAEAVAPTLRLEPSLPGRYRPGDVRDVVTDPLNIEAELGWQPKVSLEEGLGLYLEWFLAQNNIADMFSAAEPDLIAAGIVRA